eukprot:gnl/TRDRNA2_/TRDRNA2_35400_c0_seq1.p1 gnl/TRDRNA2_/TRDRNA2_35400_c0~~gnl/TRDRNA2_/TRDRNA2_35400_c0_seq1.p1  ORF type:complete len:744 (+),score=112.98 gnl/TRDRNA2_/TRDRNA2_35400_c0_seq1:59-2233(+)
MAGAPAKVAANGPPWTVRCAPPLQLSKDLMVNLLANGYDYDNRSVAVVVAEGNSLFEQRQLEQAIEVFGAAYELARINAVYSPLNHDLALRRALCCSMMGQHQRALQEAELALQIIHHAPTALLVCGIIYSKLNRIDEADHAFQRAVEQCYLLRDFVDCILAFCEQARGNCDRAIHICSQVILRSPKNTFALLVRGDAYKFHESGYYTGKAAEDYTAALELDYTLQPLVGMRVSIGKDSRAEELLLKFHPWLSKQGPRGYEEYPLYFKRRPFLVVCLVLVAIGKLRLLVRSTRLVQNACKRQEEFMLLRAAHEKKMDDLMQMQDSLAAFESHSDVWGPADPGSRAQKYRRSWMEQPVDFPRRRSDPASGNLASDLDSFLTMCPPEDDEVGEESILKEVPLPCSDGGALVPATGAPDRNFSSVASGGGTSVPSSSGGVFSLPPGPAAGGGVSLARQLALLEPGERGLATTQLVPTPSVASFVSGDARSTPVPFSPSASAAASGNADRRRVSAFLNDKGGNVDSNGTCAAEAHPLSTARFQKIGELWDEKRWLAKALELADERNKAGELDGTQVTLGTGSASPVFSPQQGVSPPQTPPPATRGSLQHAGGKFGLVDALERFGPDVLPDWYSVVDEIFEIPDMKPFTARPEPCVADGGLAGLPGYSYVVSKAGPHGGHQSAPRSAAPPEPAPVSDAVFKRYRHRLLATSSPGRTLKTSAAAGGRVRV